MERAEGVPTPGGLRGLPAVDELLRRLDARGTSLPRPLLVKTVRDLVAGVRKEVQEGSCPPRPEEWDDMLAEACRRVQRGLLGRLINATGVVLHTNFGRAPLGSEVRAALTAATSGYSNLEYEVERGERGSRHVHCASLLCLLAGAEAALVVNNGAAAILLALSAVASGREVILSRGELIEIGGSFRMPEILLQSGCRLVEVGTTNRTHLSDYEQAVSPDTGAILKVHPSNYRITGFTSSVAATQLAHLARRYAVPLIEDLGSGVLLDTKVFGLAHEPTVQEALASGVDMVTCSGDKLLGGPQAGLILGRQELLDLCQRHPLARALRVGKLTLTALQATLLHYLRGEAEEHVPVWRMCSLSAESIGERAATLVKRLRRAADQSVRLAVTPGQSAIGGGSLPGETLPTMLLAIDGAGCFAPAMLAAKLRCHLPPVIGRIEGGCLLLDLRTVDPCDDDTVGAALEAALAR